MESFLFSPSDKQNGCIVTAGHCRHMQRSEETVIDNVLIMGEHFNNRHEELDLGDK